eukprot:scaffold258673_cov21-Tisochrysis_lutea.AAC.1
MFTFKTFLKACAAESEGWLKEHKHLHVPSFAMSKTCNAASPGLFLTSYALCRKVSISGSNELMS